MLGFRVVSGASNAPSRSMHKRMEPIEIRFGKAVRAEREKQGISQEAFAVQAGVHRTYVSSIELGKVQVSIRVAQQLADALGVPLSKLWKKTENS